MRVNSYNVSLLYRINEILSKVGFILTFVISITLVVLSRNDSFFTSNISYISSKSIIPFVKITQIPKNILVGFNGVIKNSFDLKKKNFELKKKNEELESLYIDAIRVKDENRDLKNLLKFTSVLNSKLIASSNVLNFISGYNNRLTIPIGNKKFPELRIGDIIVSKKGMVGRVSKVHSDISKVILLTDVASKVPVSIPEIDMNAMLVGNNSSMPEIVYFSKDHNIKKGMMVYTSIDEDVMGEKIFIGRISSVGKSHIYVQLAQNIKNISSISVLSNNLQKISSYIDDGSSKSQSEDD